MSLRLVLVLCLILAALAAALWVWSRPRLPDAETVQAAYATPLPPVAAPLRVYHLGHSLVGRDMPAMLAQLAGDGHEHDSQLGWGASLKQHWEPDLPVPGFDAENTHTQFRPADQAIASGDYDAVVLTEMVELKDAIKYHDSARYLGKWADLARDASDDTQIYLYETWHPLDDPAGWLTRLQDDLGTLWETQLLLPDLARTPDRPLHVIPAGQVMAAFARRIDQGDIDGIDSIKDLFARTADGSLDMIHLNDLGNYLVALTHYAVLYRRTPIGLPHQLTRADGSPAQAPSARAARAMQDTVWQVVRAYPKTGVAP